MLFFCCGPSGLRQEHQYSDGLGFESLCRFQLCQQILCMYIHLYSDSSDCLGSKYCACCWLYWLRISVMCKVRLAMLSRRPPRRVSSSSIASTYSCNINNFRRVTHITIKYIIIPTKICCAASASPAF